MILSYKSVSGLTGLSRSTIYRLWKEGKSFPLPILDEHGRVVGWNPITIKKWIEKRVSERVGCTSLHKYGGIHKG